MVARTLGELVAFQFAHEYKREVYKILDGSPQALGDFKFLSQIREATSGVEGCIAEGFGRRRREAEFAQFVRYALGSLEEAQVKLLDGTDRRYYKVEDCEAALAWARRTAEVATKLLASLERRIARERQSGSQSRNTQRRRT
jgi:four helix bundle protein